MLKLENTEISQIQLIQLGAQINHNGVIKPLYSNTPLSQVSFENMTDGKKITILAEYWISSLLKSCQTITSLEQLNWLKAAAKHLVFRGNNESIERISQAVSLLDEFQKENNNLISVKYWLDTIFNTLEKPWIAYSEKNFLNNLYNQQTNQPDINLDISQNKNSDELLNADIEKILQMADRKVKLPGKLQRKYSSNKAFLLKLAIKEVTKSPKVFKLFITSLPDLACSAKGCVVNSLSMGVDLLKKNTPSKTTALVLAPKSNVIRYAKGLIDPSLPFTVYDSITAIRSLLNPESASKDIRDAAVSLLIIGGETATTSLLVASSASNPVSFTVTVSWMVISQGYSAASTLYELKDFNLSTLERYNTFSRAFWFLPPHPAVQKFTQHKRILDEASKNYALILEKDDSIDFIASSIGKFNTDLLDFKDFLVKEYGDNTAQLVIPKVHYIQETGGYVTTKPVLNPKPYQDEYEKYQANNTIVPTSIKIVLDKETKLRKLSRLTPALPSHDNKLLCGTNFRESEPKETAGYADSQWNCDNSFILGRSEEKNPLPVRTGIFDLSLAKSGEIDLGEDRQGFISTFLFSDNFDNNSAFTLKSTRNNSPETNFIASLKGFPPGSLVCDPAYGLTSNTACNLDMSHVDQIYSIVMEDNTLTTIETDTNNIISRTKIRYPVNYIGHRGPQKINCKSSDIRGVIFIQGGLANNVAAELIDCQRGLLGSHIIIKNTVPMEAQYSIQEYSTHITFYNNEKQQVNFTFWTTMTNFLASHKFEYSPKENILAIKKINTNITVLTIKNYNRPDYLGITFTDTEKTKFLPQFLEPIESAGTTIITSSFWYNMPLFVRYRDILQQAKNKHQTLLVNHSNLQLMGYFSDADSFSSLPRIILGTKGTNLFIIDNSYYLSTLKYIAGNNESDYYKIDKNLFSLQTNTPHTLTIDNCSDSPNQIDELHLPLSKNEFNVSLHLKNLQISFPEYPQFNLHFKDFSLSNLCRHLKIIDSEGITFIPYLNNDDTVTLIPYYSADNSFIELDSNSKKIALTNRRMLEQPFTLYRTEDTLYWISNTTKISCPIHKFEQNILLESFKPNSDFSIDKTTFIGSIPLETTNAQDMVSMLQKKIRDSMEIHYVDFKDKDSNFLIQPPKESNNAYLEFNNVPTEINLRSNRENNLRISVAYNEQKIILQITPFPKDKLLGIIVAGKLLPIQLPITQLDSTILQNKTRELKLALLEYLLDPYLEKFPYKIKTEALHLLLELLFNQPYLPHPELEKILCQVFDFSSTEALYAFYENAASIKHDIEEVPILANAFSIFYLKFGIKYPEHIEKIDHFFDKTNFFKDFESRLANDFLSLYRAVETFYLGNSQKNIQFSILLYRKYSFTNLRSNNFIKLYQTSPVSKFIDLSNSLPSDGNKKSSYLDFSQIPEAITLSAHEKDLLINIFIENVVNIKLEKITVKNALANPSHCLTGIIVNGKLLPVRLFKLTPATLEQYNAELEKALWKIWINEEVNQLKTSIQGMKYKKYQDKAIGLLLNKVIPPLQALPYSDIIKLYPLLDFDKEEHLLSFNKEYLAQNEESFSANEEVIITKLFILYLSILETQLSQYVRTSNILFQSDYEHLFKNLLQAIHNSIHYRKQFKETIYDPIFLNKTGSALFSIDFVNYNYNIGISSFYNQNDHIIPTSQSTNQIGYINFDIVPENIDLLFDDEDLLLIIYNAQQQKGTIRIKKWEKSLIREIHVAGIFFHSLTTLLYIPNILEYTIISIRKKLLTDLLDSGLTNLSTDSPDYKKKAINIILKLFPSSVYPDLFSLLGLSSEKELASFLLYDKEVTPQELLKITQLFTFFYAKITIEKPDYKTYFSALISDKFLFENFESNIKNDFPNLKKNFTSEVSNLEQIRLISHSIVTFQDLKVIPPRKAKRYDNLQSLQALEERESNIIHYPFAPGTNNIIHHNQIQTIKSGIETWATAPEAERKKFFLDLGDTADAAKPQVNSLSLTRENNDLIFSFAYNNRAESKTELTFKNYDNQEHRISGVIANGEILFDALEHLEIGDHISLEKIIKAALIKVWAQRERQKLLKDSSDEFILRKYLILQALTQPSPNIGAITTAFGFTSPKAFYEFHKDYLIEYSQEKTSTTVLRTSIYEKFGSSLFFKLIYSYVIEATQTSLTIEQIQQIFPVLKKTVLEKFVETYQTIPHSKLSIQDKELLKRAFFNVQFEESDTKDTSSLTEYYISIPAGASHEVYYSNSKFGFREKVYLDFADIHYDQITVVLNVEEDEVVFYATHGNEVVKRGSISNWSDPNFQIYGFADTKLNWTLEFPHVATFEEFMTIKRDFQPKLNEVVNEALQRHNTQNQMQGDEPIAASLTVGKDVLSDTVYHSRQNHAQYLPEKEPQFKTIADTAEATEDLGNWISRAWGVGATVLGAAVSYGTWLLRRRGCARSKPLLPTTVIAAETMNLLNQPVSAFLDKDLRPGCQQENLNRLSHSFASFEESRTEKNDSLSNIMGNWDEQGSLMGLNLIARHISGEKYNTPIGNFSYDRQQQEKHAEIMQTFLHAQEWQMQNQAGYWNDDENNYSPSFTDLFNSTDNCKVQNFCYPSSINSSILAKQLNKEHAQEQLLH